MQRRKTALAVAVVALAAATLTPASASAGSIVNIEGARLAWSLEHRDADFDAAAEYQQRFRGEFDFTAKDESTIGTIMAASIDNGSYEKYGLHLSDAELAELDRRGRISQQLTPITEAFVGTGLSEEDQWENPDLTNQEVWGYAFAGSWIDQVDGGRLRLAVFTDSVEADASTSRALAVADALVARGGLAADDFEVVAARYSYADLLDAQAGWVAGAKEAGVLYDSPGFSSAIELKTNELVVYYGSNSQRAYAEKFVKSMPEGMVRIGGSGVTAVDRSSDPQANHSWPHAGLVFHLDKYDSTAYTTTCTWGLTARTTSYVYAITAVHCSPYEPVPAPVWEWANWTTSTASQGHRHDTYHGA